MKYKSPSTGEDCTAAQLISEIMVTRAATKKGISLPYKFWNLNEWRSKYKTQILIVNSLLKVYSAQAILVAIQRKEINWCYSLKMPQVIAVIEEEENKLNKQKQAVELSEKIQTQNPNEFRQINTGQISKKARLD